MTTKSNKTISKNETNQKSKSNASSTGTLRIDVSLMDRIKKEVSELNKRKVGSRKIKISEYIQLAIDSIPEEKKEELAGQTVTGFDFFEMGFTKYLKTIGKISKDTFMAKIASGEIILVDFLKEDAPVYKVA